MSRKKAEFEHRTSIFEGAYRAWSCLGGLKPIDLETKSVSELDPLTNPLQSDNRCITGKPVKRQPNNNNSNISNNSNINNSNKNTANNNSDPELDNNFDYNFMQGRKIYPYEPLPRSGLAHPFVQAILSPWLGTDAKEEEVIVGLTTLRTWWQHRRRGENGSAIIALSTPHMRIVVDSYMQHFFHLVHGLVTKDEEQPPRTLMIQMNERKKSRKKKISKKRLRDEEVGNLWSSGSNSGPVSPTVLTTSNLLQLPPDSDVGLQNFGNGNRNVITAATTNPYATSSSNNLDTTSNASLDKLYEDATLEESNVDNIVTPNQPNFDIHDNFLSTNSTSAITNDESTSSVMVTNNLVGKMGIPLMTTEVQTNTPLSYIHNVVTTDSNDHNINCCSNNPVNTSSNNHRNTEAVPNNTIVGGGDPITTPVVFVSENGDIQIAMSIDGITCASCVKIVETVLGGCHGKNSPIPGLLDAVADMNLKRVLIKIDKSSNAKRIAYEATRNLAMVGYTAEVKEMRTDYGNKGKIDLDMLSEAFLAVGATDKSDVFDWSLFCACPDNGVLKEDCPRHSQMNTRIFESFDSREEKSNKYTTQCGMRYGGECTCDSNCECKSDSNCQCKSNQPINVEDTAFQPSEYNSTSLSNTFPNRSNGSCCGGGGGDRDQHLDSLLPSNISSHRSSGSCCGNNSSKSSSLASSISNTKNPISTPFQKESSVGRTLSALSTLSIDWTSIQDFDNDLDASSNLNSFGSLNNDLSLKGEKAVSISEGCSMRFGGVCNCGPTCACVGCPIHDKSFKQERTAATKSLTPSYSFGQTVNNYGSNYTMQTNMLQNTPHQNPESLQNHYVTYQT